MKKVILLVLFICITGCTCSYKIAKILPQNMHISIPNSLNMVPQGLEVIDNYVLISYYDYTKNNNSLIYVLDKYGQVVNICTLDIISHASAIAYDENNNILWVSGNYGYICKFDIRDVINRKTAKKLKEYYVGDNLISYENPEEVSVNIMTIDENILYVGNFSLQNNAIIKRYKINTFKKLLELEYIDSFEIPNKVQGIDFYHDDENKYMLLSMSYGRKKDSFIRKYLFQEDIIDYRSKDISYEVIKTDPMLEQIVVENKFIYALYESSSNLYFDCPRINNELAIIDINLFK